MQPKPLAVLAYLALAAGAGGGPVRRDVLLAQFWPQLDEDRGRAALRQTLFHLRRAIGGPAVPVRADDSVALSPGAIDCDATAFDDALARGAPADALALYRAPLLDGHHVDGVSPELEQWWDAARARYARAAHGAAWALAERAVAEGDGAAAGRLARQALAFAPDDEVALRRGLTLLERIGDRAGALAVAAAFADRLRDEFGTTPDAATAALVARLREPVRRPPGLTANDGGGAPAPEVPSVLVPAPETHQSPARRAWPRLRQRYVAVAVALALLGALGLAAGVGTRAPAIVEAATAHRDVLDPATITAGSLLTRRLFSEGLTRLYRQSDAVEAARLFESALSEDSSCAMCAYAAARADLDVDMGLSRRLLRTAVRLSDRVSPRERLVIRQWWAALTNAPEQLALADSLAAQFPDDPEVALARGSALEVDGRFLEALPEYARVLREPSPPRGAECPRCAAHAAVVRAYWSADSIDAAARAARDWTSAEPGSTTAWMHLATALALADRYDEALAAVDAAARVTGRPDAGTDLVVRAVLALRAERYDTADAALRVIASSGTATERESALWWRAITLRHRGRPRAALALVQGPLRWAGERGLLQADYPQTLLEGQCLLESGRAREAAALFRALSTRREPEDGGMPGVVARKRVWALTHAGTALAAAGDTGALAALADTVEWEGRRSALARDHVLHHYLRGLLLVARGEPDSARAAFHRAVSSQTHGYSRAGLAEARLLVASGQAREAIPLLRLTLRGELEASNLYVTRPELHEALARAYDAVGRPDSAAVQWNAVARAWADGEAAYRARADTARAHLAASTRGGRRAAVRPQ